MWNPEQYYKFSSERTRPALELIARIPDYNYKSIIDLGCGTGGITNILKNKYKHSNIIGLDSSKEMLKKTANEYSTITWRQGNIVDFSGEYDLVFSNAALQWLDNHEELFSKMIAQTNHALAIQMPNNFNYPSHLLLRETIYENESFYKKLKEIIRDAPVLSKEKYFEILYKKVSYLDIWETTYLHQLSGESSVLEWVKGTALIPIKARLDMREYIEFESRYNEKLLNVYSQLDSGITLLPFNRLFIIAVK